MGVPAFFRWLSRKYASIVVHCVEEKGKECNGVCIPVDTTKPNPNEVEFDNLYLDMNGIIHPCTHPEDKAAPKNEDEMMVAIFEYIDRLFNIVRPRRVLYMAIDGVAPRAKMNQQRSRRFRASKEGAELVEEKTRIREEVIGKGGYLPPDEIKERFDSNCITPGTEFMDNLAQCLRYYVAERISNDPGWKNVTVILSDASVPGEGEHKIMDYIRRQRAQPNHDPNTHHCLCGADADLIMLGLATHEPNFTIIREEFKPNKPRPCALCNQLGHELKECQGTAREKQGEYLARELTMASLPFPFDFERSIDDWVFMCFFVGNDFLPHLPSLEIREGAIDRLVTIYKDVVHKTGAVGVAEDNIFKKRKEDDEGFKRRMKEKKKRMKNERGPAHMTSGQFAPQALGRRDKPDADAAQSLKASMKNGGNGRAAAQTAAGLWEDGWRQRYYKTKFDVEATDDDFRQKVVRSYVEGLCWVLRYYYQGCASWKWYFPFHYAPFASDFKEIKGMFDDFEKDTKPLMGVFPAASGNFLPPTWRSLMSSPPTFVFKRFFFTQDSSIIDFYPDDFAIDLNGKKYAWQGVALLPFVDERRLWAALADVYPDLTTEEQRRNSLGSDLMFVGKSHPLFDFIHELYRTESNEDTEIPAELCHGIQGLLNLDDKPILPDQPVTSPIPTLRDIAHNSAIVQGSCLRERLCVQGGPPLRSKDAQCGAEARGLGEREQTTMETPNGLQPAPTAGPPGPVWIQSSGSQYEQKPTWRRGGGGEEEEEEEEEEVEEEEVSIATLLLQTPTKETTEVNKAGDTSLSNIPAEQFIGNASVLPAAPVPSQQQQQQQQQYGSGSGGHGWNRATQAQGSAYQQNQQNQSRGGAAPPPQPQQPGGYQQGFDDRRDNRGQHHQGYGSRGFPTPPPSRRYDWNN
ncbi:hypothetical protein F7725_020018 [Dissostichus mawsoni]|uniref:5'-3' exoribonuclease n=1 Tax=Dissostichus mawsoni TaxID=36200 RepID=A0A7J5YNG5_DISMA|nr:hypothetical protein F7725_020018 [Dissostichus mawsoni]